MAYGQNNFMEMLFTIVYNDDSVILVKIHTTTLRHAQFNEKENEKKLRYPADLVDRTRKIIYIREFTTKQRVSRRYNLKVVSMEMQEGDLVLRKMVAPNRLGKFLPNWEGLYGIC